MARLCVSAKIRLHPLEQAFDDKMIEYEKKEKDKFDKKHNKVLTDRDDTRKVWMVVWSVSVSRILRTQCVNSKSGTSCSARAGRSL